MQLGTRWAMGGDPPRSLPGVMVAAIRSVEAEIASTDSDTRGWAWTLTYLESRPVVELDDGTRIRWLPDSDHAVVTSADLDDFAT